MTQKLPQKSHAGQHVQETAPAIILVHPQLGDNIGAAMRAMLNCGFGDIRLVAPREGWIEDRAESSSSGAWEILGRPKIYDTTQEAIADLNYIYASTARPRDMIKTVFSPRKAATHMISAPAETRQGILFGCEKAGLANEDLTLADSIISFPLNPNFMSLNLAQAVLMVTYEWWMQTHEYCDEKLVMNETQPASKQELQSLFDHLEQELENTGFLGLPHKRTRMVQNIRNTLLRAQFTEQEVRTWRGIITALTRWRGDGSVMAAKIKDRQN